MDYIYIFVIGMCFASFLGALMFRLETKLKWKEMLFSRSHCDSCNRDLEWYELIPVISWIISRGSCKTCGVKITIFYPISELFLGIAFVIIYKYNFLNFWPYLFIMFLFSLSYYDYLTKSIPQWLTHLTLVFGLIFFIANFSPLRLYTLVYFAILAIGILLLNLVKKSFGFGDVLLLLFFALILNPAPFLVFLFNTLYLAAFSGIYLIFRNRKNINTYLPLVPFMTLSYLLIPLTEGLYFDLALRLFRLN